MNQEISVEEKPTANKFSDIFRKNDYLLKKISCFTGIILAFATGLLFVLLGDAKLSCESTWLIGATLLSFGSGVFGVLSVVFKEKPVLKYLFKSFAIAFCLGFIGLIIGFYLNKAVQFADDKPYRDANSTMFIIVIIFAVLTVIPQIADVVLEATIKEE